MSPLPRPWPAVARASAAGLIMLSLSCRDYPYDSPQAGVLEIRLAVRSSRDSLFLPFSQSSLFLAVLNSVQALDGDGLTLRIYSDLSAIRRSPQHLNLLDPSARDSIPILGKVYAPPAVFTDIEIRMEFADTIYLPVPDQAYVNRIPVVWPPDAVPTDLNVVSGVAIRVEESCTTRVVVTLDLDQSLLRRPEEFELHPTFYVSSTVIH